MKRKILSIVLVLTLVLTMIPVASGFALSTLVELSIETETVNTSKDSEITYTVFYKANDVCTGIQFDLNIPAGLTQTYMNNSGKLTDGFAATANADGEASYTELTKRVIIGSLSGLTKETKIPVMQFKCTVDEKAAGPLETSLKSVTVLGENWITVDPSEVSLTPATVTVLVPVTGIELNKDATSITVGKNETLTAAVTPAGATNKTVIWSSTDDTVASVAGGVVSAHKVGTATITAATQDGNFTDTCEVTVTAKPNPPAYDAPANVAATYGQVLSEVALVNPGGNTAGSWAWDAPATPVGDVGTRSFKATFTPTSDDYATVSGIDVEVTVNPKAINDVAIAAIPDQQYTGNQLTPAVTVTGDGGKTLALNSDYTVAYGANVNVGANGGSVTVSAKAGGNYTFGDVNKTFNIVAQAGQVTISGDLNVKFGVAVPDVTIDQHGSDGAVTVYYYTNEACTAGQTAVKPTAVGSYWAKAEMAAGTNHGSAVSNVIGFAISRADITPVVDITGWTFGETANDPSVTGNTGNGTVAYLYKVKGADDNTYAAAVPVNAGSYTVKAEIEATANYNAASAVKDFTIAQKNISGAAIAAVADQAYTGSAIKPEPTVTLGSALVKGTDFDYTYESNTYVGNAAVIKAVGKGNYTGTATGQFSIVAAEQTPAITAAASVTKGGKTLDLKPLVTGAMGDVSFAINGADNGCTISNGVLTSGDNAGSVKINVAITEKDANGDQVVEYTAYSATDAITVTINDKAAQDTLTVTSGTAVTYGKTLDLTVSGGSGSGAVTYNVVNGTGEATVNGNVLTPVKAGTVIVTAAKAEDDTYNSAVSAPVEITIAQAPLTVTAKSYTIKVNGTVPDLSQGTHYTVTGLVGNDTIGGTITVKYQQNGQDATPDKTKTGTYDIVVSGAAAPNANYAAPTHVNGTLKIEQEYVGGGGYYVPTVQKPTIEAGEGVKVTLSADGKVAAIEALEGYELESVKLNDTEKGIVKEVKDLKTGDKLVVTAKKLPTAEETLAALMGEYKLVARSKRTDAPSGRKAIMIRWYDENDKELDFDGVEIFRSVKKNEGYGTKPIFTSKSGKYYNTSIETGTRYYYMVRGYVELDGVKYYTDWSKKAIRTAE